MMLAVDRTVMSTAERQHRYFLYGTAQMLLAVDRTVVYTAERQQKYNCYFYMVQPRCCWLFIVPGWCPRLSDNINIILMLYGPAQMLLAVDRTVVSTAERPQKYNCYVYMVQQQCCWLLIVPWCPRLSDNNTNNC